MKCHNIFMTIIAAVLVVLLFLVIYQSCRPDIPDGFPEVPTSIELKCAKTDNIVVSRHALDTIITQFNENVQKIEKRNNEVVRQRMESFDSNISLWLAFIAAICTLLPMASAFYQATNTSKALDNLKKEIEKQQNVIEKQQKDLENKIKGYEKKVEQAQITSLLGTLVQSLRLLCDMEDFRFKGKIVLADKEYLKKLVLGVEDVVKSVSSMANCCDDNLDDKQMALIHSSITIAYRALSDLLTIIEGIAPDGIIFKVLTEKDCVRSQFASFIKDEKSANIIRYEIATIASHTSATIELLKKCIDEK